MVPVIRRAPSAGSGKQKIRALPRSRGYRGCGCRGPEQLSNILRFSAAPDRLPGR
jgi:hypothetical protein